MAVTFDATYYLQTYTDVLVAFNNGAYGTMTAAEAALYHYNTYGWKELRNPSSDFNTAYYLTTYSDVTTAKTNPLTHFLAYGAKEGRAPNSTLAGVAATFNSTLYLSSNADVQAAITAGTVSTAYQHWVLYGASEGRAAYNTSGTLLSSSGTTGSTYTLTTGTENITGTSGNDTLYGTTLNAAAGSTLTIADTISLGSGSADKAVINMASTAMAITASNLPTLTGVEIVELTNESGATSLVGSLAPSITTFNASSSAVNSTTNTITVAPATLTTVGLSSLTGTGDNVSITYASGALTGSADTLTLNVSGLYSGAANDSAANAADFVVAGAAGSAGFETVTINASGTQSSIGTFTINDNAASTLTTLNLNNTSSGALKIWGTVDFKGTNSAGTITASGSTGGVDVTVGTDKVTMTGGSGNDIIRFATAGDLDSNDSINLGTGTNAVIVADTAISSTTTALNTAINAITTATQVGFSAAASVDASLLTNATTLLLAGSGINYTVTKLASTKTIEVDGLTAGTADLTATLGYNTANLKLVADGAAQAGVGATTLTGQGTFNIESTSIATQATANTIAAITNSDNLVVNLTGSQNLTITSFSNSVALSASAYTGKLTVTGSNTASSFTGGSGNDTITGGTGADTLIGGAGADQINTGADGAVTTVITGGTGVDAINLQHVAASAAVTTLNVTAAESYATASQYDTVTFSDGTAVGGNTVTLTTGVTSTTVNAATSVTVGTTAVTAGSFLVVNASGSVAAANANLTVYQDSNSSGVIDATDLRVDFAVGGTDTLAVSIVGGKLVVTDVFV
jgi:hypothetical protein